MGCDIHLYKEKQIDGKWLIADMDWEGEEDDFDVPFQKRFTDRNYNLFGALSKGVREEFEFSFEPRGMPLQLSEQVNTMMIGWGADGHSHSYLYLHELIEFAQFIKEKNIKISGMKDRAGLKRLNDSIASGEPDWKLLFPYCQLTNAPDYDDFSVEVPASFMIGDSIERIINSFTDIDGENHRIVFFFDN